MSSLSDRLKSLGVKVGARDLPKPELKHRASFQTTLSLTPITTTTGVAYTKEELFSIGHRETIQDCYPTFLRTLAGWSNQEIVTRLDPNEFAFLDTETTGLSGGTGTIPFLIGIGRFEDDHFRLIQFFLHDPAEEQALLEAVEQYLAPSKAVVTFNGKSFDQPIINSRYQLHGLHPPLPNLASIDLLHLSRRLWRYRLPSRTLGNIEVQILGTSRTSDDVPGWAIPQMYLDYLHSGDAEPLKNVLYHNAMDVVSMAALFNYLTCILSDPLSAQIDHIVDLVALGRLYEDLGEFDTAIKLYTNFLSSFRNYQIPVNFSEILPETIFLEAIHHLVQIYKRHENYSAAIQLLIQAADLHNIDAHIELAKIYEHRLKSYQDATYWTESAMDLVSQDELQSGERYQLRADLEHRLKRLKLKSNNYGIRDQEIPKI